MSTMRLIGRRSMLAVGGTLAVAAWPRKLRAQEALKDLTTALQRSRTPTAAPDIVFVDAGGAKHHLSDLRGHGVVLNLWATWCAPCVAEMPSLAALSKGVAPHNVVVLPLSSDQGGAAAVAAFFRQHGITGLPVLLDPDGDAERAFNVPGIPTSVIIDKSGMVQARVEGSADWSTPAALALVCKLAGG
jgi:thiol-disulfide isomerase/thioredoxin